MHAERLRVRPLLSTETVLVIVPRVNKDEGEVTKVRSGHPFVHVTYQTNGSHLRRCGAVVIYKVELDGLAKKRIVDSLCDGNRSSGVQVLVAYSRSDFYRIAARLIGDGVLQIDVDPDPVPKIPEGYTGSAITLAAPERGTLANRPRRNRRTVRNGTSPADDRDRSITLEQLIEPIIRGKEGTPREVATEILSVVQESFPLSNPQSIAHAIRTVREASLPITTDSPSLYEIVNNDLEMAQEAGLPIDVAMSTLIAKATQLFKAKRIAADARKFAREFLRTHPWPDSETAP
jgi:hypothetical protein